MQMLASNRRPCAVRRFPPGCGRHPNAAAAGPQPYHQLPTTAAAETKPTLPNPSALAATNAAPPPAIQTLPATAASGAQAPGRGVGSGRKAAAPAVVTVPRVSAVRRYPPGCGRDVALAKPKPPTDSEGKAGCQDGAGKPSAVVGNGGGAGNGRNAAAVVAVPRVSAVRRYPPGCGRDVSLSKPKPPDSGSEGGAGKPSAAVGGHGDAKARACEDGEVMLRASAVGPAEFCSDGGMANGGDGEAGAQEDGGGKPWEVSGLMAVPFLPWAQHERRSQLKA